jgi:predicted alpha-1,2-mannosidase
MPSTLTVEGVTTGDYKHIHLECSEVTGATKYEWRITRKTNYDVRLEATTSEPEVFISVSAFHYLYNYAGEPWKTQYWAREVMDRLYNYQPDGYCGDEDNGQTSAWYVFSALGFYPVCPGSNEYVIGSPLFNKMTIHLENGRKVEINAPNNTSKRRYVSNIKFNGRTHTKNYFSHQELMKGAKIDLSMSETPDKKRGIKQSDFPYSFSNEKK